MSRKTVATLKSIHTILLVDIRVVFFFEDRYPGDGQIRHASLSYLRSRSGNDFPSISHSLATLHQAIILEQVLWGGIDHDERVKRSTKNR